MAKINLLPWRAERGSSDRQSLLPCWEFALLPRSLWSSV